MKQSLTDWLRWRIEGKAPTYTIRLRWWYAVYIAAKALTQERVQFDLDDRFIKRCKRRVMRKAIKEQKDK